MSKLIHEYQDLCAKKTIEFDHHQFVLIEELQFILNQLQHKHWSRWFNPFKKKNKHQGVYVYGGVGTGKTFLMNLFFNSLGQVPKIRLHFFEFMHFIHQEMASHQGMRNPLKRIAKQLAQKYTVICFDEFFVKDIVDAMLFRRLFEALFAEGMTIIITSNLSPHDLYKNGLQRELFLPAIALLADRMNVFHLTSVQDYRRTKSKSKKDCFFVNGIDSSMNIQEQMNSFFLRYADAAEINSDALSILGRSIACVKRSNKIAWFDFSVLCSSPRSAADYLEIVKSHRVVMLSHVPLIHADQKNRVLLFIQLIDILYEAHALLIASFDVELTDLYQKGQYAFDFLRTQSRLHEMNSEAYQNEFIFN